MLSLGFVTRYAPKPTKKYRHVERCNSCGHKVHSRSMEGTRAHMFVCQLSHYAHTAPEYDLDPNAKEPFPGYRLFTCFICDQNYLFHPEGWKRHMNTCYEIWANPPVQQALGFSRYNCPKCGRCVYLPGVKVVGQLHTSVLEHEPPPDSPPRPGVFEESADLLQNEKRFAAELTYRSSMAWGKVCSMHTCACRYKGSTVADHEWMSGPLPKAKAVPTDVVYEDIHADAMQTLMGAGKDPVVAVAKGVYQTTDRNDLTDSARVQAKLSLLYRNRGWLNDIGDERTHVVELWDSNLR